MNMDEAALYIDDTLLFLIYQGKLVMSE